MAALTLSEAEHAALQKLLLGKTPARVSCRAQALLWLAEGESPEHNSLKLSPFESRADTGRGLARFDYDAECLKSQRKKTEQ